MKKIIIYSFIAGLAISPSFSASGASGWDFDPDLQAASPQKAQVEPEWPGLSNGGASPQQGSAYIQDLGKIADDLEDLPGDIVDEARSAVYGSQTASPAAARAYAEHLKDKERQAELSKGKAEILQEMFRDAFAQGAPQETIENYINNNAETPEYADKNLLVFVSSSMQDSVISNFLNVLGNNRQTAFVLRGLVDNDISKIMPTQKWVRKLLCPGGEDANECFQAPMDINPDLFTRFGITHVPAVVYVPSPDALLTSCDGPVAVEEKDFWVYYGDFSPYKSIAEFQKARPNDTTLMALAGAILPKGYYEQNQQPPE